jgi:hypothetical protein
MTHAALVSGEGERGRPGQGLDDARVALATEEYVQPRADSCNGDGDFLFPKLLTWRRSVVETLPIWFLLGWRPALDDLPCASPSREGEVTCDRPIRRTHSMVRINITETVRLTGP